MVYKLISSLIMMAAVIFGGLYLIMDINRDTKGVGCEGPSDDSGDMYYYWISRYFPECIEVNMTKYHNVQEEVNDKRSKETICWEKGSWYEHEYDLQEDYNLSCRQIGYYNDHLLTRSDPRDGGNIKGSFSGFLSSGHIKGRLTAYATQSAVANNALPKWEKYHLDCRNSTVEIKYFNPRPDHAFIVSTSSNTHQIKFYDDSDFVNYYVNNCIEEVGTE